MFLSELSEGIELDEDEDIEFLGNKSCRRNNDCRSYEFCNDNGKCVEDDTGRRCKYLGSFLSVSLFIYDVHALMLFIASPPYRPLG